jgi:hypothetical protein
MIKMIEAAAGSVRLGQKIAGQALDQRANLLPRRGRSCSTSPAIFSEPKARPLRDTATVYSVEHPGPAVLREAVEVFLDLLVDPSPGLACAVAQGCGFLHGSDRYRRHEPMVPVGAHRARFRMMNEMDQPKGLGVEVRFDPDFDHRLAEAEL